LVAGNIYADAVLLSAVIAAGRIPVIPTLAVGLPESSLLNANGDETASAVAIAVQPDELIFLTDVEGVKDAAGMTIEAGGDPARLLEASFVSGGMLPKLRAVKAAMDGGIRRVRVGRTVFGGVVQ
jgi:acetylglutamate kinase